MDLTIKWGFQQIGQIRIHLTQPCLLNINMEPDEKGSDPTKDIPLCREKLCGFLLLIFRSDMSYTGKVYAKLARVKLPMWVMGMVPAY